MNARPRLCAYCGVREGTSRDHVAPECLFTDPKPPNLLTVPACLECNGEKSQDDVFLRDLLTVDIDTTHPIAKHLLETKVRGAVSWNRSEVARHVVAAIDKPRFDADGKFLGMFPRADQPRDRVASIISRLVRGLFLSETGDVLPTDHALDVRRQRTEHFPMLFEKLKNPRARTYDDVFGFAWVSVLDPLRMIWLVWFHHSVLYSATSSSIREEAERAQ